VVKDITPHQMKKTTLAKANNEQHFIYIVKRPFDVLSNQYEIKILAPTYPNLNDGT
jgi:hypothetical protein